MRIFLISECVIHARVEHEALLLAEIASRAEVEFERGAGRRGVFPAAFEHDRRACARRAREAVALEMGPCGCRDSGHRCRASRHPSAAPGRRRGGCRSTAHPCCSSCRGRTRSSPPLSCRCGASLRRSSRSQIPDARRCLLPCSSSSRYRACRCRDSCHSRRAPSQRTGPR